MAISLMLTTTMLIQRLSLPRLLLLILVFIVGWTLNYTLIEANTHLVDIYGGTRIYLFGSICALSYEIVVRVNQRLKAVIVARNQENGTGSAQGLNSQAIPTPHLTSPQLTSTQSQPRTRTTPQNMAMSGVAILLIFSFILLTVSAGELIYSIGAIIFAVSGGVVGSFISHWILTLNTHSILIPDSKPSPNLALSMAQSSLEHQSLIGGVLAGALISLSSATLAPNLGFHTLSGLIGGLWAGFYHHKISHSLLPFIDDEMGLMGPCLGASLIGSLVVGPVWLIVSGSSRTLTLLNTAGISIGVGISTGLMAVLVSWFLPYLQLPLRNTLYFVNDFGLLPIRPPIKDHDSSHQPIQSDRLKFNHSIGNQISNNNQNIAQLAVI